MKSDSQPLFELTTLEELKIKKEKQIKKISNFELKEKTENIKRKSGSRKVVLTQYERNLLISEYAKRRANGICQLCNQQAPFNKTNGEPYLETHHIVWLSAGGLDTVENTVALCPNCHRKMHIINCEDDRRFLLEKNNKSLSCKQPNSLQNS